jgi:hypothetical protein
MIRAYPGALGIEKHCTLNRHYNDRVSPLGVACKTRASLDVIRTLIHETMNHNILPVQRYKVTQIYRSVPGETSKRQKIVPNGMFETAGFRMSRYVSETRRVLRVLLEEFPDGA